MPITVYDPSDYYTAGNTVINILPAVANIATPTLAEWNAGTVIQCATEEFSVSTNASTQTRRKICDKIASQIPGDRTYEAGDTVIVASDPQTANALLASLALDAVVYVGLRPGLDDDTAPAAVQKVWMDKRQVLTVDPEPVNTESGNAYAWRIKWLVIDRTYSGALVAA